jgi:hypothetical protein
MEFDDTQGSDELPSSPTLADPRTSDDVEAKLEGLRERRRDASLDAEPSSRTISVRSRRLSLAPWPSSSVPTPHSD